MSEMICVKRNDLEIKIIRVGVLVKRKQGNES